jgi:WD40 repeat protein
VPGKLSHDGDSVDRSRVKPFMLPIVLSKIFISHSSTDNAAALAVAAWLEENGWGEYFLDVQPTQGLAPGERWQEALRAAADRCEVVIFLVSPAWCESKWCFAEFVLAKQLGKRIFGVLVVPTPLPSVPQEMTSEWQLCDLTGGASRHTFQVQPPAAAPAEISFSDDGLTRLRVGLQHAGLAAATFPWPPPHDPTRAPYRGLKPLESADAAVFFGRDAAITRGLDALRRIRDRGVEQIFVILGASGAGKSSYLRGGLWPRLVRDDRHFLALPIVRPQGAVMSGAGGLVAALDSACRIRRLSLTRAEIRATVRSAEGLVRLLAELQRAAQQPFGPDSNPPTIVLAVDQGEELFGSDGRAESDALLSLLSEALRAFARLVIVFTIRSDAYDRLQSDDRLAGRSQVPFNLSPIARAEFTSIITGPAARMSAAGQALTVDPALTELLLEDARGADALPLLAFTLERLFIDYGGAGELSAGDYDRLGGVRGSIEAAVEEALAQPAREPVIPADRNVVEGLLRRAFVPWLAGIDPDTDERRRRVADWGQIPIEARPVVERLIDARVLTRDRRTVEVAHEALLRQWPMLTAWLDADADAVKAIGAVQRAAAEWGRQQRADAWLVHAGERLTDAEKHCARADFSPLLNESDSAYLGACRAKEDSARLRQLTLEREARDQADRASRTAAQADFDLATLLLEQGDVQTPRAIAHLARALRIRPDAAMASDRLVNLLTVRPWIRRVGPPMEHDADLVSASFSRDGTKVITAAFDGTVRIWDAASGAPLMDALSVSYALVSASFSPDADRFVTVSLDETQVWKSSDVTPIGSKMQVAAWASVVFSPDGTKLLASSGASAQVYDASGTPLAPPVRGADFMRTAFTPDSSSIVLVFPDRTVRFIDASMGQPIGVDLRIDSIAEQIVTAPLIAFSPDGTQLVVAAGSVAQMIDLRDRLCVGEPIRDDSVAAKDLTWVGFSPDRQWLVTGSQGGTVKLWDAASGEYVDTIARLESPVGSVAFSPDGTRFVTTSADVTPRMWETRSPRSAVPIHADDVVALAVFHPSGGTVLTAGGRRAQLWDAARGAKTSIGRYVGGAGTLATSWDGRSAEMWRAPLHTPLADFLASGSAHEVRFGPARHLIATIGSEEARLWDVTAGEPLAEPLRHTARINSLTFDQDGHRIVTASQDMTARLWDVPAGRPIGEPLPHSSGVAAAAFSQDGARVVTAAQRVAMLWDANTGAPLGEPMRHESGWVYTAGFSPDDTRIVTGSEDETARIWDASTGCQAAPPLRHRGPVRVARFSPDGRIVVTASDDGTARLWDSSSGLPFGRVMQHGDRVMCAAFTADGRRVVTASRDETARVWDAATGYPLTEPLRHDEGVDWVAFTPDERAVISVSGRGGAMFPWQWDVPRLPPPRSWFAAWVEAIVGWRFDDAGVLRPFRHTLTIPVDVPDDDPYAALARWFVASDSERTLAP